MVHDPAFGENMGISRFLGGTALRKNYGFYVRKTIISQIFAGNASIKVIIFR